MIAGLPAGLAAGIESLTHGVSRTLLAERAAAISECYRAEGGSAAVMRDRLDGIAYLLTRAPATYAATRAAFASLREVDETFAPSSVADVGAGLGSASWGALETWPSLDHVTMVDSNEIFLSLARELSQSSDAVLREAIQIKQDVRDPRLPLPGGELVVASYVLAELALHQASELCSRLWQATGDALVIVEPGTPAGYAKIIACRDILITAGASVRAPCPHNAPCPLVGADWCHFSQRLPRSRDHLLTKSATVPFEDERFSYLAVRRSPSTRRYSRILSRPEVTKAAVEVKLCTQVGLVKRTVQRRDANAYASAKRMRWGDAIE